MASEKEPVNESTQHLESGMKELPAQNANTSPDDLDSPITQADIDFIHAFEASGRHKKLLRRMDIRIIPVLIFIYLISFIDRGNIGNARIQGLTTDLGLSGQQYNWCLTVFFFTYVACEVPANLVIKWIRPSYWIPFTMILWGTVMTLQGIVKNYDQLLATRALLGVTEAGFFPAAMFIISNWYLRHEVGRRVAYLYGTAAAAGAFSGILAFGIAKLNGKAGLAGWQWIFIVEGIFTVAFGLVAPLLVPNTIELSKWLDADEKRYLRRRIHLNRGGRDKGPFQWLYVRQAFGDYKTWMFGYAFFSQGVATYGLSFTLPSIINQLGYSAANAQLLTIPPYALAALTTILFALWSDKLRKRYIFIVGPWAVAAIGLIICLAVPRPRLPGLVLFGVFLLAPGLYTAVPALIGWCGNSAGGEWKRGLVLGTFIAMGSAGGLIGSNIFLARQAPRYPVGYGVCLGMLASGFVDITILYFILKRENARRDQVSEAEVRAKYTQHELDDMADQSPLFRYEL